MATSIWNRKLDLLYLTYFSIHIPIMFAIDLTTLYPKAYIPAFSTAIKEYHIATFSDQFFVNPPPFFYFFMWMEVFFHIPVCSWAIHGIIKDSPQIPLVLLIYGMQTLLTTAVCIWEYVHWITVSTDVKWNLTGLYGPYIALSVLMVIDASLRISKVLSSQAALGSPTKKYN